ncbi:methylated-DNA--[protein]-cysteine S-methyltransferase [Nocardia amamiensis]|uniref:Methylated-DNA--[protein]-cysteine S-methyltransferase n=1 Tax=Nocardia amamiensis TaxID=404578 RepID=A0ABS0CIG5_9NOCA|nr:methylated-DNA--[protein]-cysteine S-methyltransferase [Nocardia amamiensis]MBF6296395.1 methylated-DNA--[protein]-cysteine S-methyltransferase [Nocardia amamiensis]
MSDATRLASAAARQAPEVTGSAVGPAAASRPAPVVPGAAALFDTAIGCCAIAWSGAGVIRFQLPETSPAATRARITRRRAGYQDQEIREEAPTGLIADAIASIRAHLAGELDDLRWIPVDTSGIPAFHRAVYTVTRAIDPGHTLSYGQVAERVGAPGAAQAVGQALGRNPIPLIIPCHRVLAADHALHGFSAPGGIDTKQRLLTIERTPGFGEPTLF